MMTMNTTIFPRVYSGWARSTKNVDLVRNQPQVVRITAGSILADMVNFFGLLVFPLFDLSMTPDIKESMGTNLLSSKRYPSVPLINSPCPIPAASVFVDRYFRKYPSGFFLCEHTSSIPYKLTYVQPTGWDK
jgi:hypothetical protein